MSDFDVRFLMCMTFLLWPKGGKSYCIFIHPKPKAINVLHTKCRLTLYYSGISFTSFLSLFYRGSLGTAKPGQVGWPKPKSISVV